MPLLSVPPRVPIVGQPLKILHAYPTVVVQCGCEGAGVLCLVGAHQIQACHACGREFAIVEPPVIKVGVVQRRGVGLEA